jgi:hypothetical protein
LPVEVALVQRDEVISLLAALGATVDAPINTVYGPGKSLLEWTSATVAGLSELAQPQPMTLSPTEAPPAPPTDDSWAQYRTYLDAMIRIKQDFYSATVQAPHLNQNYTLATRDYFSRAESVLRSYSVVPHQAPQSVEAPTEAVSATTTPHVVTPKESGYSRHTRYSETPIPVHLKVMYDELYEACWTGDNATIRELCLPKRLSEGKDAIQISVQTSYSDCWTPFLVAVHRRNWETARLVIAIANAQYQPPDPKGTRFGPVSSVISACK